MKVFQVQVAFLCRCRYLREDLNQEEKKIWLMFVILAQTLVIYIGEKKTFLFLVKRVCFLPFLSLAVLCGHCKFANVIVSETSLLR